MELFKTSSYIPFHIQFNFANLILINLFLYYLLKFNINFLIIVWLMNFILGGLIGYLFGAVPTAFLFVKYFSNKNILLEGSQSSGTTNAYRVSDSKLLGTLVLIIDLAKGVLPILIVKYLFNYSFELLTITAVFTVLGHSFSFWLKFNGGKGIATAAGALLLIAPLVLIIWIIIWLVGFAYKKNVYFSNITASVLTSMLCFFSADVLIKYSNPVPNSEIYFSILITIIFLIILSKHLETILSYFSRNDKK